MILFFFPLIFFLSRFGREIERDCVVNGVSLPMGATLEIPAISLHRDPEHWPDPEKFDPERSDQLFKKYIYSHSVNSVQV